jgi:type VI secretion system protein VasD
MLMMVLSACVSVPVPEKTLVEVRITATADLNPTGDGRPSPLLLRIYQLRETAKFNAAGFFPIYERDDAALGGELAGREELIVQPGQSVSVDLGEVAEGVRFVGLFAAYRNLGQAVWRKSVEIPRGETTTLFVRLETNRLSVQGGARGAGAAAEPEPGEESGSWSLSDSWNKVLDSLKSEE